MGLLAAEAVVGRSNCVSDSIVPTPAFMSAYAYDWKDDD